ncbi:MAG: hypothetical protein H7256_04785, partial [Bdellovibrio sp.]|nr:hypothetical protein [Bdellovibrio sp.]
EKSDFIFLGSISLQKSKSTCPHETASWKVKKVLRGDKALEGTVIATADHGYQFFFDEKGNPKMPPSYSASKYKDGPLNRDSNPSYIFTQKNKDGCFELSAQGAQESYAAQKEIESILIPKTVAPPIQFTTSTMTGACAPHDASSTMISIRTGTKEYPLITVNWWANPHPSPKGGEFVLESKGKDSFTEGYQGFFCATKGACKALIKVKLKAKIDENKKIGNLEFEVETVEKEIQKGEVPTEFRSDTQQMCG